MRPVTPLTATSPFMGAIAAAMATFLATGAFLLVKAGTPMAKTGSDGLILLSVASDGVPSALGEPAVRKPQPPRCVRRDLPVSEVPGGRGGQGQHMSLEERERGSVLPPPADDGSITGDGCPIDPKDAVLSWWADMAAQIEAGGDER